jgi:TM2 domain-containing membrane protein YozV
MPPFDLFDSNEDTWVWQDYLVDNHISESLGYVLDKMLARALSQRYTSAQQILDELNRHSPTRSSSVNSERSNASASAASVSDPIEPTILQLQPTPRLKITYLLWAVGLIAGNVANPLRGLHRFYNGKFVTGFLWMLPLVGDIGTILDLFLIPSLVQEYESRTKAKYGLSPRGVPLESSPAITETMTSPTHEDLKLKVLQTARDKGGVVSVEQLAVDTQIAVQDVEMLLRELEMEGLAEVNSDETGTLVYWFHDV